jgi:spoIIIJ-associated protein
MLAEELEQITKSALSMLGFEPKKIAVSGTHRTVVAVTLDDDSKRLIGPHGEHLRSLNTLLRRLVETKHGEEAANFLVDVNGYYEAKIESVRANARMLAQRARLFKHDVEMSPMSPYERLVIHELFAEDPEIKTESQGEGKFRHIVLKYKQGQNSSV